MRDLGLIYRVLWKRGNGGKQAVGLPSRAKLGGTSGAALAYDQSQSRRPRLA